MNNAKAFKFDHEKKVVLVTKTFMKAARVWGSDAFDDMMEVRKTFPEYKIETAITQKKSSKKTDRYHGLTFEYMEEYIKAHDDAEARLEAFKEVKFKSKTHKYYVSVKNWFLDTYPELKINEKKVA